MLKDLGWYNEDDEIRPLIIYLPIYRNQERDLLNVRENCIVEILYFGVNKTGKFRVTAKRLDSLYGNYWVCKCVPERTISFIDNYDDGFHYLSVNKEVAVIDRVTLNKEKSEPSLLSTDSSSIIDTMAEFGFQNYDSAIYDSNSAASAELKNNELGNISDQSLLGLNTKDSANILSSGMNEIPTKDNNTTLIDELNNLESESVFTDSGIQIDELNNLESESISTDSGIQDDSLSNLTSESIQQDSGVVSSDPSKSESEVVKSDSASGDDYSSLIME
jgi:hypothetical protein